MYRHWIHTNNVTNCSQSRAEARTSTSGQKCNFPFAQVFPYSTKLSLGIALPCQNVLVRQLQILSLILLRLPDCKYDRVHLFVENIWQRKPALHRWILFL